MESMERGALASAIETRHPDHSQPSHRDVRGGFPPAIQHSEASPMLPLTEVRSNPGPPPRRRQDIVRFLSPPSMTIFFLLGIASAVGHHEFNRIRNNKSVYSDLQQQWAIRIGTGLAFITKTTLVTAIGIAFMQHLWPTATERAITLRGLDSIFSLTTNIFSLLNTDVWKGAKVLACLALATWLLPFIVLVTPATLSVKPGYKLSIIRVAVPNINWTSNAISLNGGFGFVTGPSPVLSRIMTASAASMAELPIVAPFPNSSYSMQFFGPSYNCHPVAQSQLQEFNASVGYKLDSGRLVGPNDPNPVLYVGAAQQTNGYNAFVYAAGQNISCEVQNTSYSIQYSFLDGIQTLIPISFLPMETLGTEQQSQTPTGGAAAAYQAFGYALVSILTGFIRVGADGSVTTSGSLSDSGAGVSTLNLMNSGLIACPEIISSTLLSQSDGNFAPFMAPWMCRNGSLDAAIEDLSHNFTFSLLASAAISPISLDYKVPVKVSSFQNYFSYNPHNLILTYAIATSITLMCVLVGVYSYIRHGNSLSDSFSTIMLTTRNKDLDRLVEKHQINLKARREDIKDVKLRFGFVRAGPGEPQAVFGLEGRVSTPVKGESLF